MDLLEMLRPMLDPKQNGFVKTNVKTITLQESYCQQLKNIAASIDQTTNYLLGLLTTDQLQAVVKHHEDIAWANPKAEGHMILVGLYLANGKWMLEFETARHRQPAGFFTPHDLEISDVLGFMGSLEKIATT